MSGLVPDYSQSPIRVSIDKQDREATNNNPTAQAQYVVPHEQEQTFVPTRITYPTGAYVTTEDRQQSSAPSVTLPSQMSPARAQSQLGQPTLVSETQCQDYGKADSYSAVPFYSNPPPRQSQSKVVSSGPPGYRQNPMHDGGSTDYSGHDVQSGREMAEQAWNSVTQVAGSATETVGKAFDGGLSKVKEWLNQDSPGLR